MIVSVSPRGYGIAGDPKGNLQLGVVDTAVEHLLKHTMTTTSPLTAWPYRKQVLMEASRLFGKSFFSWIATQYQNPYLYGRNFDFLEDTLRYIRTGRRRMGVRSWKALMEEKPAALPNMKQRRVEPGLIPTYPTGTTTANVLTEWCSRPGGFEDLLQTLGVFYGAGSGENEKV